MAVVDRPIENPTRPDKPGRGTGRGAEIGTAVVPGIGTVFGAVIDKIAGRRRSVDFQKEFEQTRGFNDPFILGRTIAEQEARLQKNKDRQLRTPGSALGRLSIGTQELGQRIRRARLGVLESRQNVPIQGGIVGASALPPSVGDIFKGTKAGKVLGQVSKGPGRRPPIGRIGGIVTIGVMAGQAVIDAIEGQIKEEDELYKKTTKKQEKEDNRKVDAIREANADRRAREEREFKKSERIARDKARKEERDAKEFAVAMRRKFEKQVRDDKRIVARQRADDKAAAKASEKARKAAAKAKADKLKLIFSGIGAVIRLKIAPKNTGQRTTFNIPNPADRQLNLVPNFSFDRGQDFASLRDEQFSNSTAKTREATKTKVQKCRSDTPKRKKGVCRSGFFRETPTKTTYKTWSTRKCL